MAHEREKTAVALEAIKLVKDGMRIGLGTGSTAAPFIEALINSHLKITCVCTSINSKKLVGKAIHFLDDNLQDELDITFDGADRFDPTTFHRIKGGGGALLREKLVALRSKQNVVLVDESKLSSPLQGFPVAIEIVSFGYLSTIERLERLGYKGKLRKTLSDNGNRLFDIEYTKPILDPITEHQKIKQVSGVIETGFFFHSANIALVGYPDGRVERLER